MKRKLMISLILLSLIIAYAYHNDLYNYYFSKPKQSSEVYMNVNEAVQKLPFHIKMPEYLPRGSSPKKSKLVSYKNEVKLIEIRFLNEDNNGVFSIVASKPDSDIDIQNFEKLSQPNSYRTYYYNNQNNILYWQEDTIHYWIYGSRLIKNELIKIANSMKKV